MLYNFIARSTIQYKLFSSEIILCYQKSIIKSSCLCEGVNVGLRPTHVATFLNGLNIPAFHHSTMQTWWRHQMETFFAWLALCAGNSPVAGEVPSHRPVARSFDVFLICVWTNDWVNNRYASDLRHHLAHYDVTVMEKQKEAMAALVETTKDPTNGLWLKRWSRQTHPKAQALVRLLRPMSIMTLAARNDEHCAATTTILGHVLLLRSDTAAWISANGSAAFNESCATIG